MTLIFALPLLYFVQLIYVGNRWFGVTTAMIEDSRMERMRKVLDWSEKPEKPKERQPLIY